MTRDKTYQWFKEKQSLLDKKINNNTPILHTNYEHKSESTMTRPLLSPNTVLLEYNDEQVFHELTFGLKSSAV